MKKQNKISHLFLQGSDLQDREKEVLEDVLKRMDFIPKRLMDKSSWWGSKEIGAIRYEGEFEGKKAVLKIQGVKPATSEIYMLQAFSKANKSKIIRSPVLYTSIPWSKTKRYEALIMEYIEGEKIVNCPTAPKELERFFTLYREYRKNCVAIPCVAKPEFNLSQEIKENFSKWRQASFKLFPAYPFRKNNDKVLIDKAIEVLMKNYQGLDSEFQHGHFSAEDLLEISKNEVILLSNLYWSWRPPFYDAVFGYHWFMYKLASTNLDIDEVEKQRQMWLDEIYKLPKNKEEERLLNLAFLERAAAGLNLDALSIDPQNPLAEYFVEETRKEVEELIAMF